MISMIINSSELERMQCVGGKQAKIKAINLREYGFTLSH